MVDGSSAPASTTPPEPASPLLPPSEPEPPPPPHPEPLLDPELLPLLEPELLPELELELPLLLDPLLDPAPLELPLLLALASNAAPASFVAATGACPPHPAATATHGHAARTLHVTRTLARDMAPLRPYSKVTLASEYSIADSATE
jgi:hypothetical protein